MRSRGALPKLKTHMQLIEGLTKHAGGQRTAEQ